ncbi:MAG: hypothetical protein K0R50_4583 [Eubacterium sp.]|nr:hypothetical protein [Eubacterium sp.]
MTKSFNIGYIAENLAEDFEELANLYELLGLSISIEFDKIIVSSCMAGDAKRVDELFSVETWLKQTHKEVYDSYESAIDAYTQGHAGACIESCRTCLVSIFSKYKGTEDFAGIYNTSGESSVSSAQDLSQALNTDLRKDDLADFFYENRAGKLTKTKAIYMIYSMMSDYGTHRNESTQENPTFWVYSKKK